MQQSIQFTVNKGILSYGIYAYFSLFASIMLRMGHLCLKLFFAYIMYQGVNIYCLHNTFSDEC